MTRYGTFMKSETVSHQCTPQRTNEDMTPHSYTSAQHSGLMKIWPRIVTVHQCTAQRTNEDVTPHSYTSAQHRGLMKMWPHIVTAFDASKSFHPGAWRKSHVTTHSHWDSQMQTVIIIPADWWSLYWQFPLWRADHQRGHLTHSPILRGSPLEGKNLTVSIAHPVKWLSLTGTSFYLRFDSSLECRKWYH